jgi:hypothetical protein
MLHVSRSSVFGLLLGAGVLLVSCQSPDVPEMADSAPNDSVLVQEAPSAVEAEWLAFRDAMLADSEYDLTPILSTVDAPYPEDIAYTFRVEEEFHAALRGTTWAGLERTSYNGDPARSITMVYEGGTTVTYYFADTSDALRLLGLYPPAQ